MDRVWEKINKFTIEHNNGFIHTAQVENLGISRPMLRKYVNEGKLEMVRKGLYVLTDDIPDEYALMQEQCHVQFILMEQHFISGDSQIGHRTYMILRFPVEKMFQY